MSQDGTSIGRPLTIESLRPADVGVWDAAWDASPYATFYHGREWAEIWRAYTRGRIHPEPILVGFSDGLSAVIPYSAQSRRLGLGEVYLSSPAGTFGGWISRDELQEGHVRLLAEQMLRRRDLTWRLNPLDPLVHRVAIPAAIPDTTRILDLTEGFAPLLRRWSKTQLSACRKAEKNGIRIREAGCLADWRRYFSAYSDSLERWGARASSRYEWPLFECLARRRSRRIRLWLAEHGDQVLSGALCLYSRRHASYWHGATLSSALPLHPMPLLFREAIRHACQQGCAWFDFNPSGAHAGAETFKTRFGAAVRPCPVVRTSSGAGRLYAGLSAILRRGRPS